MSDERQQVALQVNRSMDILGYLFLMFTYLKLTEQLDWSWWWVSAPLWLPVALVVSTATIIGVVSAVIGAVRNRR